MPTRTFAVPLCVFALISVAAALLLNSVWGLCVVCVQHLERKEETLSRMTKSLAAL